MPYLAMLNILQKFPDRIQMRMTFNIQWELSCLKIHLW